MRARAAKKRSLRVFLCFPCRRGAGLDSDALSKIRKWDDSMYFSYVLEPFLARDRPAAPWVHGGYPAGETPPVVRLPPGASPYAYTA